MTDVQTEISKIVEQAAAQIAGLVKQAAIELLSNLDGAAAKARGREAASGKALAAPKAKGGKGAKRPKEEITALAKKVAAFIAKNPGLRIEQINKQLGTTTKDLTLPLKKLIAEKVIATKGEKRATTYHPKGKK